VSLEYIRDYYKVPAYKDVKVKNPKGEQGVIAGANGPHVKVKMDGVKHAQIYHPKDLEYLP
jgi:hypothetical protein